MERNQFFFDIIDPSHSCNACKRDEARNNTSQKDIVYFRRTTIFRESSRIRSSQPLSNKGSNNNNNNEDDEQRCTRAMLSATLGRLCLSEGFSCTSLTLFYSAPFFSDREKGCRLRDRDRKRREQQDGKPLIDS
jgi:hypothetical protein